MHFEKTLVTPLCFSDFFVVPCHLASLLIALRR